MCLNHLNHIIINFILNLRSKNSYFIKFRVQYVFLFMYPFFYPFISSLYVFQSVAWYVVASAFLPEHDVRNVLVSVKHCPHHQTENIIQLYLGLCGRNEFGLTTAPASHIQGKLSLCIISTLWCRKHSWRGVWCFFFVEKNRIEGATMRMVLDNIFRLFYSITTIYMCS